MCGDPYLHRLFYFNEQKILLTVLLCNLFIIVYCFPFIFYLFFLFVFVCNPLVCFLGCTFSCFGYRAVIGEIDEETDSTLDLGNIRAEPLNSVVH